MRYDGIGMGGVGGSITLLVLAGFVVFMILAAIHSRWPRVVELLFCSVIGIAVGGFWLAVFALVSFAISIPISGALDLDRSEQMLAWLASAVALYLLGSKLR